MNTDTLKKVQQIQQERIRKSVAYASVYLDIDYESIVVLDSELGIWLAYAQIDGKKILIFSNDDKIFGISSNAEEKLREWVLGQ